MLATALLLVTGRRLGHGASARAVPARQLLLLARYGLHVDQQGQPRRRAHDGKRRNDQHDASAAPPPPPPPPGVHPADIMLTDLRNDILAFVILAILVSLVGAGAAWAIPEAVKAYKKLQFQRYVAAAVEAFERGGYDLHKYDPADATVLRQHGVQRPGVIDRVARNLWRWHGSTDNSHQHNDVQRHGYAHVIGGPHGAGKSLAVRQALRLHAGLDKQLRHDAVYVHVDAGWTVEDAAKRAFGNIDVFRCRSPEGASRMNLLFKAASVYYKKHGRRPVLIIDEFDNELKYNHDDGSTPRTRAHHWAYIAKEVSRGVDIDLVFVCDDTLFNDLCIGTNDFDPSTSMLLYIGDVSDTHAIDLLVQGYNIDLADAKDAVKRITGGRLGLVHKYARDKAMGFSNDIQLSAYTTRVMATLSDLGIDQPQKYRIFRETLKRRHDGRENLHPDGLRGDFRDDLPKGHSTFIALNEKLILDPRSRAFFYFGPDRGQDYSFDDPDGSSKGDDDDDHTNYHQRKPSTCWYARYVHTYLLMATETMQ